MESTFKEEITDKLAQILESVEVIEERCKSFRILMISCKHRGG